MATRLTERVTGQGESEGTGQQRAKRTCMMREQRPNKTATATTTFSKCILQ